MPGRLLTRWDAASKISTLEFMRYAWTPGENSRGASGRRISATTFLTTTIGCSPVGKVLDINELDKSIKVDQWLVSDIESCLIRKFPDYTTNVSFSSSSGKVILCKSTMLILAPDGIFNFSYAAKQWFRINLLTVELLNQLLGAQSGQEKKSIFFRRNLTERDGSPIRLTTHLPRHWRNMLLNLMGLSNVQQALAMGRRDVGQNRTYQHATLAEKTQLQRDYFDFISSEEKTKALQSGILAGNIIGSLTDIFNEVKHDYGSETAQYFLEAHARAMHIVPGGVCTRDFDLSPCPKFLKCLEGCGNLHFLGTDRERKSVSELYETSKKHLNKMIAEYGDDPRYKEGIDRQKIKVTAIEINLEKFIKGAVTQAFPGGKKFNEEADNSQNYEMF